MDLGTLRARLALDTDEFDSGIKRAQRRVGEFDSTSAETKLGADASEVEAKVKGAEKRVAGFDGERGEAKLGADDSEVGSKVKGAEKRVAGFDGERGEAKLDVDDSKVDSGLRGVSGKLAAFGSRAAKLGAAAGAAAGAAIGAAIVAGVNLEPARRKVAAQLGATGADADKISKAAGQVFAANWGESMGDAAQRTGVVVSSIRGMREASAEEIARVTGLVSGISDAFEIDAARISQVVGQMLTTGMAKDAQEGADLLASALSKVPANVREDVLDAADEYGPFFKQLGIAGTQSMDMLVKGAEKGMYGIDKTGDAVKEFTIRATDGSKASSAAYKAIGLDGQRMATEIAAGGERANRATQQVIDGLLGIKDPALQSQTAIALFGTPLEDLSTQDLPKFLQGLKGASGSLGQVEGAAQRMGDTLSNSVSAKLETIKRSLTVALSDAVTAYVLPALNSALDALMSFGGWVQRNSSWIVPLTAALVGAGAALAVFANASRIAALAVSIGSRALTMFSGALALITSPIGLTILAIAAVAGIIMYLWRTNETFRNAVVAAWNWISTTISTVWTGYIQPALMALYQWLMVRIIPVWRFLKGVVSDAWNWISAAISAAWTGYILPAFTALKNWITGTLVPTVLNFWRNVIVPAWQGISSAVSWAWNNLIRPAFAAIVSFITTLLIPWIRFLWTSVVAPAFRAIGAIIAAAWNGVIKPALSALWGFIKNVLAPGVSWLWNNIVAPAFKGIGNAIKWAWDKVIKPAFDQLSAGLKALPGAFTAAKDAIGKAWSAIKKAALTPVEFVVQTVLNQGLIKGINKIGGTFGVSVPYIPWTVKLASGGMVPGYSPSSTADNIPAMLTAGEHVTRVASVRSMNRKYPGTLDYINRTGTLPGYASGGTVYDSERPGPGMGGRTSPLRRGEYQRDQGVWRKLGAWATKNYPGARVTSGFRQTRTATGRISNHARGLAVDLVAPNMMGLFNLIANKFGGRSIELIHSPAGGRQISRGRPHYFSGVTRANHFDHVHWSMPSFDGVGGDFDLGGGGFGFFNPFDAIKGAVTGLLGKIPGANTLPGQLAKGMATHTVDKIGSWFGEKAASMFGFGGGSDSPYNGPVGRGVEQWRGLALKALQMTGQPASLVNTLLRRMNQESTGNPNAINRWDINAKRGDPSKGLMQVIGGTFRQYAMPGYNSNIYDPLSNILASIRYAVSRYGSLARAYNKKGGYALGTGNATRGLHLVGERGPELVNFRGGERVYPTSELRERYAGPQTEINIHGVAGDKVDDLKNELWFAQSRVANRAGRGVA